MIGLYILATETRLLTRSAAEKESRSMDASRRLLQDFDGSAAAASFFGFDLAPAYAELRS